MRNKLKSAVAKGVGGIKKYLTFLILLFILTLIPTSAQAVCPVCTIAVAGGVGFSRWLGIDDTITGLWIGGLIVSFIFWTINWLNKKNIRFFGRKIIITVAYYLLTILPLYYTNIMGHHLNKIWGIDKLLFGITIGSIAFLAGALTYQKVKEKRGKAHFHFQKVLMPIAPLIILSLVFYFLMK